MISMANQMPTHQKAKATFNDPPAIGSVPSGDAVTSQPTSDLQHGGSKLFMQAGQILSQGLGRLPGGPIPARPGPGGNVASAGVPFPAAGQGPGTGLTTKPGIVGDTLARPRTPFGQGGFGGSK
jgi:hypothetical protein